LSPIADWLLWVVVKDQIDDRLEPTCYSHVSHNGMAADHWRVFGKGCHDAPDLLGQGQTTSQGIGVSLRHIGDLYTLYKGMEGQV